MLEELLELLKGTSSRFIFSIYVESLATWLIIFILCIYLFLFPLFVFFKKKLKENVGFKHHWDWTLFIIYIKHENHDYRHCFCSYSLYWGVRHINFSGSVIFNSCELWLYYIFFRLINLLNLCYTKTNMSAHKKKLNQNQ